MKSPEVPPAAAPSEPVGPSTRVRRASFRRVALVLVALVAVGGVTGVALVSLGGPSPSVEPWEQSPPPAGLPAIGLPPATELSVHQGDLRITQDGTVIRGLDIRGNVYVEASDVLIEDSIIRSRTVDDNVGLINVEEPTVRDLRVTRTTLRPSTPQVFLTGVYGHDFTLDRVDISGVVDAVHVYGDRVRVVDSWLHDLSHFAVDEYQGGGPTHDDGVQVQSGNDIWIRGNVISDATNAAVQVTQGRGPVSRLLIEDNVLSGGSCVINLTQKMRGRTAAQSDPLSRVVIRGNTFGASRFGCDMIIDTPSVPEVIIEKNTGDDGREPVVVRRPV